jgi:integrase
VHVRRQLRWDSRGRPYFCLPKGRKVHDVPLHRFLAQRARAHFRRFPPVGCKLPWRNPEEPTTPLEERQRKPITVRLVLSTSRGLRINYKTWNERSWKPALVAAGVIRTAGESIVSVSAWLGHSSPKITLDHYAHFMPGAGKRGLASMDSWFASASGPEVPEKSLAHLGLTNLVLKPQVSATLRAAAALKVKYKETARGGLAVNVIEC